MAYKKGGVQKRGLIEEQGSQKSLQYFCLPRWGNRKVTLVVTGSSNVKWWIKPTKQTTSAKKGLTFLACIYMYQPVLKRWSVTVQMHEGLQNVLQPHQMVFFHPKGNMILQFLTHCIVSNNWFCISPAKLCRVKSVITLMKSIKRRRQIFWM